MIYTNETEYRNQMEGTLTLLEYAHQVATKINKSFMNVNAHADAENKGCVVVFTDDYTKRVRAPYSYFNANYDTDFRYRVRDCLNVIDGKAYETNKIKRVLK